MLGLESKFYGFESRSLYHFYCGDVGEVANTEHCECFIEGSIPSRHILAIQLSKEHYWLWLIVFFVSVCKI